MSREGFSGLINAIPHAASVRSRDGKQSISNQLFLNIENQEVFFSDENRTFPSVSDALSFLEEKYPESPFPLHIRWDIRDNGVVKHFTPSVTNLHDNSEHQNEILIILTDITEQQNTIEELESQLGTFWQIGELSSLLLRSGDTDSILRQALSWMGEMMKMDRIIICEHQDNYGIQALIRKRYIWEKKSGKGTFFTDEPHSGYQEPYVQWYPELSQGKTITIETSEFSKTVAGTQNNTGIRSYIIVPIKIGYEFVGTFSFETCAPKTRWLEKEKTALSSFATIIGQFIQRSRTVAILHWNEALLSEMAGSSPLGFFVVDNRTDAILYANEQFCTIWKLDSVQDEIRTGKIKNNDIIPYCIPLLADPASFAASCAPLQDEQNRISIDDEIPFLDGRTIRRFSTQIRGQNDEYYGRFYIFEDISDKKRTLNEIQEREEKLRAIFENQQAMLIIDGETRKIVNINNEAAQLIGLSPDEIIGKVCHQFICPAEHKKCPIMDLGQTVDRSERVLISHSRGSVPVIKAVHPVVQGNNTLLIESFTDITERKRNEENFKKINQCLLSFGPDPLDNINKLTGLAGKLLNGDYAWYRRFEKGMVFLAGIWHINPHPGLCEEVTGCIGYDGIVSRSSQLITIPNVMQSPFAHSDPLVPLYQFRTCVCKTVRAGREDPGTLCVAFATEKKTTLAENQLLSVIAAAIGMEEERRKALDQLNDFAYIISHDLKAPLRGIASLSQWMQDDYQDQLPVEGRENLQLLQSRVQRMQQLIDGVLEYSRIGRVREKKENIQLRPLILEIVDVLTIPSSFTVKIPEEMPIIWSDRTQITQVFENLISNAIKYVGREDAIIEVLIDKTENQYLFGIRDNGQGIDPKNHERIFQIFQTVHQKSDSHSTGIGLTIVRKIIEHLGGRIWVESDIGKGSTFYFTIPFESGNENLNEQGTG